jgi:hypothetical protein
MGLVGVGDLTPKMSEADAWRGACASTIRDKYPASLHRLVRLSVFIHCGPAAEKVLTK